ncbi:MAG: hypothetical protein Ct9H300mP1_12050 [Planctomycetaceae bacterium]|nr:MAG: hypothetical protein Ct9H300mP1_12050 [Planctomycetaceae bacterium]
MPVVGSGYSWLQDYAPHAAAANLPVGRWPWSARAAERFRTPTSRGRCRNRTTQSQQVCRTFSYCTNLMRTKDHPLGQFPTGCPPFDKETYGPLWKEAEPKLTGKAE